jgi:hypothetical protein
MIEKCGSTSTAVKTHGSQRLGYLPGGGKRHGSLPKDIMLPEKRFMSLPKQGEEPLDAEEFAMKVAELVVKRLKAKDEWLDLDDVPDRFGISKSASWLRERWHRKVGAPRPSTVANATHTVRASEVERWLDSLRAEDQAIVLRRDAIVSRQAGRTGRLTLDVPTQGDA